MPRVSNSVKSRKFALKAIRSFDPVSEYTVLLEDYTNILKINVRTNK